MPKTIRLAVYFNNELRAVKELAVPFVIGRSHDANLTIPHPMVSRRHCLIFEVNGTFRLQDLGSLNGTCLGQERIPEMELHTGSEFLIGNIRFVFNPVDVPESPEFPTVPDSDIVKTDIPMEFPEDLPPPLPPYSVKPPQSIVAPSPVVQTMPTPPQFSLTPGERDGMLALNDVIDLAVVADKKTSSPTPLRE